MCVVWGSIPQAADCTLGPSLGTARRVGGPLQSAAATDVCVRACVRACLWGLVCVVPARCLCEWVQYGVGGGQGGVGGRDREEVVALVFC